MGRDICDRLIPLIGYLRRHIPLKLSTLHSSALIQEGSLTSNIDCRDLATSDIYFDSFRTKYVLYL
jgi:hypothetical protein